MIEGESLGGQATEMFGYREWSKEEKRFEKGLCCSIRSLSSPAPGQCLLFLGSTSSTLHELIHHDQTILEAVELLVSLFSCELQSVRAVTKPK